MMMACVAGLMVMMMALSVAAGSVEAATIEDVARSDDRGNKIEDGMLTPVADHHLDKQAEEAHAPRRIKGIAQTKEVASPESIAIRSHDTHSERGMGAESTHERRRRLPDTSLGGAFCEASPLWDQRVDESSYEIGCEEISVRATISGVAANQCDRISVHFRLASVVNSHILDRPSVDT